MATPTKFFLSSICMVFWLSSCLTPSAAFDRPSNTSVPNDAPTSVQSLLVSSASSHLVTWVLGFSFATIICLSSMLGYFIIPSTSSPSSSSTDDPLSIFHVSYLHNVLEGLALGSLLASAIFHLIPHAFDLVGQDREHNYLIRSLLIFSGIYLFYWSEKLMLLITDYRQQGHQDQKSPLTCLVDGPHHGPSHGLAPSVPHNKGPHEEVIGERKKQMAWMVMMGDALHNFMDGLSLGAALADSHLTGLSIGIAILFEEIPHELGDFAILLSSGLTHRQAAASNFLSASTCYLGLVIALLCGDIWSTSNSNSYIFALSAGMFLYISVFNVMTDLNDNFAVCRKLGTSASLKMLLCQNLGILTGVYVLYSLAQFDEKLLLQSLHIEL